MITQLNRFRDLVDHYDAFLIDAWGVLHDGVTPYGGAIEALRELKSAEKPVVIISNASRRSEQVAAEMQRLGLTPDLYAHLATSGEAAWQALKVRADDQHRDLGRRCYYLGPDRSRNLMDGLGLDEVSHIEDASFLLVTGVVDPIDELETYRVILDKALSPNLVLVSANSDRIAISGGKTYYCGGRWPGFTVPWAAPVCITENRICRFIRLVLRRWRVFPKIAFWRWAIPLKPICPVPRTRASTPCLFKVEFMATS
ncbi:MAG: TIGR01459 family HAD-type hydrolase [Rhodospirillaceae bacterium]|nr:MAG: TIGR01459 family HAD-type hydrolase [Rhodospirillaceae bacterium]